MAGALAWGGRYLWSPSASRADRPALLRLPDESPSALVKCAPFHYCKLVGLVSASQTAASVSAWLNSPS